MMGQLPFHGSLCSTVLTTLELVFVSILSRYDSEDIWRIDMCTTKIQFLKSLFCS